jgi:metallo-beta-lactamase class B
MRFVHLAVLIASVISTAQTRPPLKADPPQVCGDCEAWNRPFEPFRVYGNSYYVGVDGLSALLLTSSEGHSLLDGALSQSAPLIDANIRALGFRTEDIRLIVTSHAHFDHVGGVAALQRVSGATVAASPSSARALEAGMPTPDDPQYAYGDGFPSVNGVKVVKDREVLRVGPLAIIAHFTPGHTPGSTTWTWQSCEGARCVNVVYADSLNAVSAPGFRFSGDATRPSTADQFRQTITRVEQMPCDIAISVHPSFTDVAKKRARQKQQPDVNPFVDANTCRGYAGDARKRLEARLAQEGAR